jgi:agmatine deiminase
MDPNFKPLQDNLRRLEKSKNEKGEKLNIVPLPMPGCVEYEGDRLPASYANFLIANNVVLVPIFKHKNDDKALDILENLFPKRKVIGIPCQEMVVGLGAIHCVSQQQPKI